VRVVGGRDRDDARAFAEKAMAHELAAIVLNVDLSEVTVAVESEGG
jgi:hypothetical protein